jgi:uncharacterized protein YwgA
MEIANLLQAAGGEIVGKVRLQKVVYLLDQLGMQSGFSYEYHHYGPYSAELARAVDESVFSHRIDEIVRRRTDGVPYSVFRLPAEANLEAAVGPVGELPIEPARRLLASMVGRDATVLELAATVHWLTSVEHVADWRKELTRRKGIKASTNRVEQATALLEQIGLPIA